jgi:hypothetical protein
VVIADLSVGDGDAEEQLTEQPQLFIGLRQSLQSNGCGPFGGGGRDAVLTA